MTREILHISQRAPRRERPSRRAIWAVVSLVGGTLA